MVADFDSVFNILIKASVTKVNHVMIDIKTASHAYDRGNIFRMVWIRTHDNLAGSLTKFSKCVALEKLLESRKLHTTVEQWVECIYIERKREIRSEDGQEQLARMGHFFGVRKARRNVRNSDHGEDKAEHN